MPTRSVAAGSAINQMRNSNPDRRPHLCELLSFIVRAARDCVHERSGAGADPPKRRQGCTPIHESGTRRAWHEAADPAYLIHVGSERGVKWTRSGGAAARSEGGLMLPPIGCGTYLRAVHDRCSRDRPRAGRGLWPPHLIPSCSQVPAGLSMTRRMTFRI